MTLILYTDYCGFCGNNKVPKHISCCPECETKIAELGQARAFFDEAIEQYGRCCSGLSGDHLFLHSEGFDSDYEDAGMRVEVEAGIQFHATGVLCYWLFDNDSTCDSFEFGAMIPYHEDMEAFWTLVMAQLEQAAEVAWNSDVLTCSGCGYHYHVGNDDHDDCHDG